MDQMIHFGAIAYGLLLVLGMFVRTPVTEALRIDALFIPQAGDASRPLNFLLGLLIAGYGAWSLWSATAA
ncbi:MAG TPA: hypothetical protein PKC60_12830 [Hydrogenophaga sp.]|uniref:hypothetical protein n=1 Tax=Hydrogenophaga sp. TaxID=1904254 RepID=UPI002D03ECF5|nr:hypothetical protein [Hydrogenophaga sp.]HMN94107.1 hypothetical protein [Hydrogenophaga sp.]HMP10877.1 hypothetical protein [Hydrogenophaga sp.]